MKKYSQHFVKQCTRGDRQSQQQLFNDLYASMYRTCHRYLKDQAEAEDALMRGFMKSFQNLKDFKYKEDYGLYAWIRRIMVNESLGALRKQHNFMLTLEEEVHEVSIPSDALTNIHAEELETLILQLPTGYRTVFNLFVVEGYEHKEIAKMLNISESTSKTQLAKARAKLREMIEKNDLHYANTGR